MQRMTDEGCVLTCTVTQCSYNEHEECLAPAVEVGSDHPECDTYTTGPASRTAHDALVRMCHVRDCTFNRQEGCTATGVTVGFHAEHADCMTFRPV